MPSKTQNPSGSTLGLKLAAARKAARLTQADVASVAGCSVRSVYVAEAGQGETRLFLRLAAALGLEPACRSLPSGAHLGERIRASRKAKGISQAELAIASGTSANTVAALERGSLGHIAVLERVTGALAAGLTLVPRGRSTSFFSTAVSSAFEAWTTPQDVLDRLYRVVGASRFDVDPCSPLRGRSRVLARTRYDELDDGLQQCWHGVIYMNPPYGRDIGRWTTKARHEVSAGRASLVIGLVPARTDTRWWHGDIAAHADVWLLKGRLRFGDGTTGAPFPSALVMWNATSENRRAMSVEFPEAQHIASASRLIDVVKLAAD